MKTIDTLIEDIYAVLDTDNYTLTGTSARKPREEGDRRLRMSSIGKPCVRQLWYSINDPEGGEALPPHTKLKFCYGDLLEDIILDLAEMAGHKVTHRQSVLEINGIKGHNDAVIDGVVVDVKSASKYSFQKFKDHLTREQDAFGYIDQLGSYLYALRDDPEVVTKDKAAFLAINKETGSLCLDVHSFDETYFRYLQDRYTGVIAAIQGPDLPERAFDPTPEGKSGNYKLDTQCSYCAFKFKCYPEARTFLYSSGPKFLTTVSSTPRVTEVDQEGNIITEGFNF